MAVSNLFFIFLDNLLPIFLLAGAGFVLGRQLQVEARPLSRLTFYLLSPCLVFNSLKNTVLSDLAFGQMFFFTLALIAGLVLIGGGLGWLLRLKRPALVGFIIAGTFVNSGNYGLPLTQFAFGEVALSHALVFFVASTLAVYTLGVGVASLGRNTWATTWRTALTLPTNYALLAAGLLRLTQWPLPTFVDRATTLAGQAALPVMLVILGLQVAQTIKPELWQGPRLRLVWWATGLQLVVGPALGFGLAWLFGLRGPALQAAILEAAMPTAVITTILAAEYDLDLTLINGTVILSTLLSPLTLTPLIAYLQTVS